jgi:hypothetical protein
MPIFFFTCDDHLGCSFFYLGRQIFWPGTTIFNLGRTYFYHFSLTWELLLHDLDGTDGHVQLVHEVLGEVAEFQVPGPRNTLITTLGQIV